MQELYKTFRLSERKGTGGMTFKYVPNEDVITRMNKVFKGNWSTVVQHKDTIEDQVLVEVQVTITDPDSGEIYTQTGFGSSQIARFKEGPNAGKIVDIGNAYKGSLSKAIVNACTRWGVGLIKESNPYVEEDYTPVMDNTTTTPAPTITVPNIPNIPTPPAPAVSNNVAVPPATNNTPVPPTPPMAAPTPPATPVVPTPTVVPEIEEAPKSEAPPIVETTATFPPPMMPEQIVSASVNLEQVKPTASPAPPMEPIRPVENTVPSTPDLPFSKVEGLAGVVISDVQKVALKGILSMNNANYEELAKEAFDANGISKPVPTKENLSYEEAVAVIKFGNEKYRKNR